MRFRPRRKRRSSQASSESRWSGTSGSRISRKNDHALNLNAQRFAFAAQITGTIGGVFIVIAMIICGTVLLFKGVSAAGVAMIIGAIGGLVGTAVYGHRKAKLPERTPATAEGREVERRTP